MEAPDKIYIPIIEEDGKKLICSNWWETDTSNAYVHETIQYIRKDALLEKIDDAIAHLSDGSLTGYYESLAYKDIRELIESM